MKKNMITTSLWDASEHLETDEDMVMYLEAAFEDGDPALISAVLGDIARAKGMSQIAEETGLGRTSLYKALSPEGHPDFATVLKVINALGIKLQAISVKSKSQCHTKKQSYNSTCLTSFPQTPADKLCFSEFIWNN